MRHALGLRAHLDQALGRRTSQVVRAVAAALGSGGSGDAEYQDELQGSSGYFFHDDDDQDAVFEGPVAVAAGRQDRVVGYSDQFRKMALYPRGTFVVADQAGHDLPYEQPDLLRTVTLEWLHRCGIG